MKKGIQFLTMADTHLGHERMKELCDRPDDFESQILSGVKKHTHDNSVLIHLGDFCFYREEYWHKTFMDAVKGRKWLVRGNHDKKSITWYLEHGWECVVDQMALNLFGKKILLSHKPVEDVSQFDINIHGHHHNNRHHPEDVVSIKHLCVYPEHDYIPIPLRSLLNV